MKKLIVIAASIMCIFILGPFCLAAYGQLLCSDGFSAGMPNGRVFSADEPPYPYLPTVLPKEPPVAPILPLEPLG